MFFPGKDRNTEPGIFHEDRQVVIIGKERVTGRKAAGVSNGSRVILTEAFPGKEQAQDRETIQEDRHRAEIVIDQA